MALAKRARVDDDSDMADPSTMLMTVASSGEGQRKNALVRSIKRTSGLEAPIVSLAGAHGVSWIDLLMGQTWWDPDRWKDPRSWSGGQ